jgi:adenylylsulfate kinase
MFVPPDRFDVRVTAQGSARHWAEKVLALLCPTFDAGRPTALLMGRFQPFHDGHRRLIKSAIARVGQACIAVRDTHGIDAKNPLSFFDVKSRIEAGCASMRGALW